MLAQTSGATNFKEFAHSFQWRARTLMDCSVLVFTCFENFSVQCKISVSFFTYLAVQKVYEVDTDNEVYHFNKKRTRNNGQKLVNGIHNQNKSESEFTHTKKLQDVIFHVPNH